MEFIKILTLIKSLNVWKEELIFIFFLLLSGCNHKESEKIIFVGDSLIRNWDTERCLPFIESENLGVDGYRMRDCRNININDSEATVVLLVGTNDLILSDKTGYEDDFADEYIKLVEGYVCKRIICISILPKDGFGYEVISSINKSIMNRLKAKKNYVFLDVAEDFLYNGDINPEYTVDGLHLNTKGYDLLSSKLCDAL